MKERLNSVAAKFHPWHSQEKRGRIPNKLKQQAVEVCQQFPITTVADKIKINPKALSLWCQKNTASCSFVPLTIEETTELHSNLSLMDKATHDKPFEVVLQLPGELTMSLSGDNLPQGEDFRAK